MQEKRKKSEVPSEPNFLWSMAENFLKNLFREAEKKIQQGAEEASFFLKKKISVFFLLFFGSSLFLVGIALALEKALAFWGFPGWGLILTGGLMLLLAGLVNKIKR